ncbi:MAG: hypothetical protein AABX39_05885 [Nanoarchaeota archaeon]
MPFKPLEDAVREERSEFLVSMGLDKSILSDSFRTNSVEIMRDSYKFFSELGSNVPEIFKVHPLLLSLRRDISLEPKLRFFLNDIGLSKNQVLKNPELFTRSIDTMVGIYIHFLDKFNENEEQVKTMFRDATTLLGNKIELIDDKIQKYTEAGIDFHQHYSLLELTPEKVIDTREYLNELRILNPENKKWYYMLLSVSRNVIKPKVEYCEREMIDWRVCPRVLVSGLGTEEVPGALPRRVEMIKNAFKGAEIPPDLNYKLNPVTLTIKDEVLRNRIRRYT